MSQTESPRDRQFQVWAVNGTIHSGYDSESVAQSACDRANKASEQLGTKTRFEIRER